MKCWLQSSTSSPVECFPECYLVFAVSRAVTADFILFKISSLFFSRIVARLTSESVFTVSVMIHSHTRHPPPLNSQTNHQFHWLNLSIITGHLDWTFSYLNALIFNTSQFCSCRYQLTGADYIEREIVHTNIGQVKLRRRPNNHQLHFFFIVMPPS